jgi:hypothetical protein
VTGAALQALHDAHWQTPQSRGLAIHRAAREYGRSDASVARELAAVAADMRRERQAANWRARAANTESWAWR